LSDEQDLSQKLRLARFDGLLARVNLARAAGLTFGGKRDVAQAAGYDEKITPEMYRLAYKRGGIAKRIVDAFPDATWRGTGDLVEDEDPNVSTAFEEAWQELRDRLKIWRVFHRADRLAGLGDYSVILIGAQDGALDTPLTRANAKQIAFLWAFQQDDAQVNTVEEDSAKERFGKPLSYRIARLNKEQNKQIVHYSRVLHIADDMLDDPNSGTPRLECVWDLLTNLAKVNAAGPESYWRNADPGKQFDIDPEVTYDTEERAKAREETEAYAHGLQRNIWTRGIKVKEFGADVADMKNHVDPIYEQISGATGIPLRILKGSERGDLASTQDRENWNDRIRERRDDFAEPFIVRPFIDRMIELGVLPKPVEYTVRWPRLSSMTIEEAVSAVDKVAGAGQKMGTPIMIVDELRETFLDLAPLADVLPDDEADDFIQGIAREAPEAIEAELVEPPQQALPPAVERAAAERFDHVTRSEQPDDAPWRAVHRAADKHAPAFVDHFYTLFTEAKNLVSVKRLEKDVRSGDRESAFVNLNRAIIHVERNIGDGLIKVLEAAIGDGGDAAEKATPSKFRANAIEMNFDRANHEAARWARERSSQLIVQISEEMRDAIRLIIERGFEQRKTPRETARVLRSMVGLTDRQAASLQKRYAELLAQGYTATDSARAIMHEAERKLQARAMLIARTETLAASNEGARELWQQAQYEGVLGENARREWIATEGKRTCKICMAMDGQVRMLNEPFSTPDGIAVMSPPLHPACRCAHGVTNRQRQAPEVAA
jgi:hypothetical protein